MLRGAIERSRRPRPSSSAREARVARHLAADADGDARAQRRLDRELDQPQHGRMQRVVEMGDLLVAAIDGQRVLDQVVGADREEIGLGGERVGGERRTGHLDHHAERRQRIGQCRTPRRLSRRATWSSASRTWRISPTSEIIGSRMRSGPSRAGAQHGGELRVEQPAAPSATGGWRAGRAPGWRRAAPVTRSATARACRRRYRACAR